ncbi:MAG: helix-turn-helix transcriptional regulator [Lentisphaerae bacterium]|nr:helix-turn-helix transcriptional regulator [Lentisphaerota bacterium]MCP4102841.1 helix-turn-helix transcriptional regulator [Lentisphaerota bacterium]
MNTIVLCAEIMSESAVMVKKPEFDISKLIEDSLEFKLQACSEITIPQRKAGNWVTSAFSAFSLMLEGDVVTEYKEGEKIHRAPGQLSYFPANKWRRTLVNSENGARFVWVRGHFRVLNGLDLLSFYDVPRVVAFDDKGIIKVIMRAFIALDNSNEKNPMVIAVKRKALGFRLLSIILDAATIKPSAQRRIMELERFLPVIDYINLHYLEDVNVDQLAEMACLSKSQFHRQFKSALNLAPFEYVKKLRLNKAVKLLQRTDLNIAEIAEQAGWNDQFHFSRIFKASTGLSPQKYRQHMHTDFGAFLAGL